MIIKFLKIVESIPEEGAINSEVVRYCERFLEFTIDLEALLPTRRFFNTVLDDSHLLVRCFISPLNRRPEGKLFSQVSLFFIKYKFLFISLKLSWKWWDSYWIGDGMFGDNLIFIAAIHVCQFIAIIPFDARCVCYGLVITACFPQKKAYMLLSNYTNVKHYWRLKGICHNVDVEKIIIFQPWEYKENPGSAHCDKNQYKHYEARKMSRN